jgi:membrane associated rhomboid family serine protease
MPVCPSCGKKFSGFSFGSNPATECRDCRKTKAAADQTAATNQVAATGSTRALQRAPLPVVTLTIIGLNLLVYVAMGLSGASWESPSIRDALRWGADLGPLTLSTQPWRLLTSTFVHFGFAHIFFNMWCLLNLGRSLEFLMGRRTFAATYLASGLAASMVSVAYDPWRVSAGASGAIFGVAGAFADYMYVRKIPSIPGTVRQTRGSLAIFILYNLASGAAHSGIDNSAHLGGLVAGLILGAAIPPIVTIRKPELGAAPTVLQPVQVVDVASEEEVGAARIAMRVLMGALAVLVIALAAVHSQRAEVAAYGRAVGFVRSGQPNQAIKTLQSNEKANSGLFAQVLLGQLLLDQGRAAEAIGPLDHALTQDPHDEEIEHNLALAYLGAGYPSKADEEIGNVFFAEKKAPAAVYFIRGVAEGENSNLDSALADLMSCLEAYPDWPEAKVALEHFEAERQPDPSAKTAGARAIRTEGTESANAASPPPITIPYGQLVMKSPEWPLYP